MKNLLLNITQDYINRGVCSSPRHCAVALIIHDTFNSGLDFPKTSDVLVGMSSVEIRHPFRDEIRYLFQVHRDCMFWLYRHDIGKASPTKMVLDFEQRILRMATEKDLEELG